MCNVYFVLYGAFKTIITKLFYLDLSGKTFNIKKFHAKIYVIKWWKQKHFKNCCFYIPEINKVENIIFKLCVPSNFIANRQVPKFFLNNCAQSSKKTFMYPKFCTNPVLNCHLSTNLSNFLNLCLLYCRKLLALAPTNRRFAEKNRLSGNTAKLQLFLGGKD